MNTLRNNIICRTLLGTFLALFLIVAPMSLNLTHVQHAHAQVSELDKAKAIARANDTGIEIGEWILSTGAYVAGIGGVLLDLSLRNFVVNMKETLSGTSEESSLSGVIENMWSVVRDIANIVFIFGFIYIGIVTIFRPDSSRVKGFLAQLIIAALLINFSLFFVRVIIDIADLFAGEIHKYIPSGEGTDIGLAFAHLMGLSGLYGELPAAQLARLTSGGAIAFFVIGTIFMMIAGFVMAAGAALLVARFVALILFMIFSPLLFAAAVFMDTSAYWKKLFNYAFFAPAFLFLLYLAYRVLESAPWNKSDDLATVLTQSALDTDGYAIILQFTVALFFLIAALKSADALGVMGGKAAVKFGKKLTGYGQRVIGGALKTTGAVAVGSAALGARGAAAGTAAIGRRTVGKHLGYKLAEGKYTSKTGKKFQETVQKAAKSSGIRGALGRGALVGAKKVSEASFDFRNIADGKIGKKLGIGTGAKGASYAKIVKDIEKRNKDLAKMIKEDPQTYKDNNVENEFNAYKRAVANRNNMLKNLSTTTASGSREMLQNQIDELESEIKYMETANTKKAQMPQSMAAGMTPQQIQTREEQFKKFAQVKKSAEGLAREQFAANLESRGENLLPIIKQAYNLFINNTVANKSAANAVRKEIKKSPDQKLLDAVKANKS